MKFVSKFISAPPPYRICAEATLPSSFLIFSIVRCATSTVGNLGWARLARKKCFVLFLDTHVSQESCMESWEVVRRRAFWERGRWCTVWWEEVLSVTWPKRSPPEDSARQQLGGGNCMPCVHECILIVRIERGRVKCQGQLQVSVVWWRVGAK